MTNLLLVPVQASVSLLGSLASLMRPPAGKSIAESFYLQTKKTEDSLGDVAAAAFRAGDDIQRTVLGFLARSVSTQALHPAHWTDSFMQVVRQGEDATRLFESSSERDLAVQQVRNTIAVFNLVKNIRERLGEVPGAPLPLLDLVEKAYALGEYPDLWAVEGLGHDYAKSVWTGSFSQQGIMCSGLAALLPEKSLTMMHAGLGLCFAEQLMETITPYSDPARIQETIEGHVNLCRQNSRPGYAGCAIESLGLVTRTWHPRMVGPVDAQLQRMPEDERGYFWHGLGRALYFSPSHLVPSLFSPWSIVDQEACDDLSRKSARAGIAWATVLVNMRHPRILLSLLHNRAGQIRQDDSFANGVASCVTMSSDTTPGSSVLREFLAYSPPACNQMVASLWEEQIRRPAAAAVQLYQPVLHATGHLEEVFRYRPLDAVVSALDSTHAGRNT